jgi:hypothetical protein
VTPRSATGIPNTGSAASFRSAEELPYRGTPFLIPVNAEAVISISGRAGNANTVQIYSYLDTAFNGLPGTMLIATLVAPDGTTYPVGTIPTMSSHGTVITATINLSRHPVNGVWKLRVTTSNGILGAKLADFRMYFDGDL